MNLDFALTSEQWKTVNSILFGDKMIRPKDPEHGFLALVFTATGATRTTLILGEIILPGDGDVSWSPSRGLVMSHKYYSRALTIASQTPGAGLLNVHSHPRPTSSDRPPRPSPEDLESDDRELRAASWALPAGRAVAAAIVSAGGGISVRQYTFARATGEKDAAAAGRQQGRYEFADRTRVVGPYLKLLSSNPTAPLQATHDPVSMSSGVALWGKPGQEILGRLRVGIAGLGGVGGILAEHLARLGVGELVLVDYDRLEKANLNRSQGALKSEADEQLTKVAVYERVAKEAATSPSFKVWSHRASAAEQEGLLPLADCDFVVGAADDAFARQILDHLAYSHLIPVVDGGTTLIAAKSGTLIAGKSQAVSAGPGHPCLECQGVYSQEEATTAREDEKWGKYLDDPSSNSEERAPSVVFNNSLVAALIGMRFLAIALGTTPSALTGTQRYYVEAGSLAWAATKTCKPDCSRHEITGLGDAHFIPVGVDLRFQAIRLREGQSAKQ